MLYSLYMEFSDFDRLFLCFCRFLINIKKYLKMTEDCSTSSGKENWYCSPSVYSVYIVFDFRETICGNLWTLRRYLTPQFPLLLNFTYMFHLRDLFCNTAVSVFRCGVSAGDAPKRAIWDCPFSLPPCPALCSITHFIRIGKHKNNWKAENFFLFGNSIEK